MVPASNLSANETRFVATNRAEERTPVCFDEQVKNLDATNNESTKELTQ
jgi:hypothetical protein